MGKISLIRQCAIHPLPAEEGEFLLQLVKSAERHGRKQHSSECNADRRKMDPFGKQTCQAEQQYRKIDEKKRTLFHIMPSWHTSPVKHTCADVLRLRP